MTVFSYRIIKTSYTAVLTAKPTHVFEILYFSTGNFNTMQLLRITLLIALVTTILVSCKKEDGEETLQSLGIHVQSQLGGEQVKLFIDGELVLNKALQTNPVLGVCMPEGIMDTKKPAGNHTISVIVDNRYTGSETFTLNNALWIGVNYNPTTHQIYFVYSSVRFMYD